MKKQKVYRNCLTFFVFVFAFVFVLLLFLFVLIHRRHHDDGSGVLDRDRNNTIASTAIDCGGEGSTSQ